MKSITRFAAAIALGGAAVCIATAAFAQATQVNVADPKKSTYVTSVSKDGHMLVRGVPPTAYFHNAAFGLYSSSGCVTIATPPSGLSLVVKQIRLDVYYDPNPGYSEDIALFAGSPCGTMVGDVNPPTVGQTIVSFDPGLTIPPGSVLSASVLGDPQAEAFVDGYTVDPRVAPNTNANAPHQGPSRQH